jgi:hypothetical protein
LEFIEKKIVRKNITFVCKKCGRIASDPDENWHGVHCPDHPLADLVVVYEVDEQNQNKQGDLQNER